MAYETDANGAVVSEQIEAIEIEAGKQFYPFLDWLNRASNGDVSWVLPNTEYEDWVSLEDAY